MPRNPRRHALIIGAGMAGLATARVLADHFESATVLDRDELPTATSRKGVPQGRHAHALLSGGARVIIELLPGIVEELVGDGAAMLDFNEGSWYQAGGYRATCQIERQVISVSRPFLEGAIRRRVASLANVRIESGATVDRLISVGDRVTGAHVCRRDGHEERVDADLVVDCSGRASQASLWMEEMGYGAPDVAEVRCDVRYGTVILPRRPGDMDGTFAVIIESPPHGKRAAFIIPIENNRWIVTIAASFGAVAPVDEESFRAIAASLPSPEVAELLSKFEQLGPVARHRLMSSKRRRYEKLKRLPAGFLALGDAICSFNPVYGQGMSSAVMQADVLDRSLGSHGNDAAMVRDFYKQAAHVIATPWQFAVGADFAHPECRGPKPPGTDMINRYMALRAARRGGLAVREHGDGQGPEPAGSAHHAFPPFDGAGGPAGRGRGTAPPTPRRAGSRGSPCGLTVGGNRLAGFAEPDVNANRR